MSRPVSVFIDDTLVTIVAGSCLIENRIEERSTASFTIIDLLGTATYQRGQVVKIYSGETATPTGTKVFAGFIETPEMVRDGNGLLHTMQCKDNHYLADKRLVVKSYPAGKTLAYIVNDIITDYLAAEGVTAGTIQTGPTFEQVIFNYVPASQCFDALKELSGFIWQINDDKTLDFIDRTTNAAPWSLTSTQIVNNSAYLSKGNPSYRNRQYVRGGKGSTSQQTEIFTGDAVTLTFTVGYPIASTPTVTVADRTPEAQTVGIKGIDSGKDCYWNKGDATITFAVAPENAKAVTIVYYGQYPLISLAEDYSGVLDRQVVEGGSGIVEDITNEAQHESAGAMQESARAKLKQYCQDAEKFNFQTRISGLKAGQMLPVTYSPFGFSSHQMLIESVSITEEDSTHLIYSITALTGPTMGSWSKLFSRMLERQDKSIKIGDSLLLVLLQQAEILTLSEATAHYEDNFSGGQVNRWIALPPAQGAGHNVEHERMSLGEAVSDTENVTKRYAWQ